MIAAMCRGVTPEAEGMWKRGEKSGLGLILWSSKNKEVAGCVGEGKRER